MSWHEELREAIGAVADQVGGAVVAVGHGAGVVVGPGRVLTNAHNLHGHEVGVAFADGRTAPANVAGVDVDGDLAVLDVDTGEAQPVAWPDGSPSPSVGQAVFALANPGGRGLRVTFGTVASTERSFRGPRGRLIGGALEHTAPLARGSSGGPVVDADGRLVGVNTHRRGDGFYLAVPATAELKAQVDRLAAGDVPQRPRLGIAVAPPQVARRLRSAVGLDDRPGLLVRHVDHDSPAERAGIRRGDLIVTAAGDEVTSTEELFGALDGLDPDASLTLGIVRGSEELTIAVTFGATREEGSA